MRPTDTHPMDPAAPAGQVCPGLAELHALCDSQPYGNDAVANAHALLDADFRILNHGSVCFLVPQTDAARIWLDEHVSYESWQQMGDGIAVEPRYLQPLLDGVEADGYSVEV